MTFRSPLLLLLTLAVAVGSLAVGPCEGAHEPPGFLNFASPQSNPIVYDAGRKRVYAANTTSNSVSVIDVGEQRVIAEIPVGIEPVGLALRPDGKELWASNHVSDSVSVIDLDPKSPTHHRVIQTIQELDEHGVSRFDEPVGIAFASDAKAYVALSSRNDVAVVDTATYQVTGRIHITAQDPRALAVRDGYLYVLPFETGNKSELSVCPAENEISPPQCTLLAEEVGDFVVRPNLPGEDVRIVVDPDVPDRDVYVIDTSTDEVVEIVESVGTLLYGLAVSGAGDVFITQTDARNAVNGTPGQNLITLENRMFDNQVARVPCTAGSCGAPTVKNLEPPLPAQPGRDEALATPYGIALSGDDSLIVATAAGTSRLFTMDPATGDVLGKLDLGKGDGRQIPKGVALQSNADGSPRNAWVLNTLANTVSMVDVRDPANPVERKIYPVGSDPTPEAVRLGRIAFNNAFASSSATFSCESCHPDGNTDQLLWRIGGACFFGLCNREDEPRSTMPVRGLDATLPLHWDGTLGDPIGGVNGSVGPNVFLDPSCSDDHGCFRHLVDASLSGVMCDQAGGCAPGISGLPGELDQLDRDDMATFLGTVKYPPARERRPDDVLTESAVAGFSDFFIDKGGLASPGGIRSCGDANNGCHNLPLMAGTNNRVLQGFDAPTLRGLNDRFVQFSIGISSAEEALHAAITGGPLPFLGILLDAPGSPLPWDPDEGFEEDVTFAASFNAFDPLYNVGPLDIFQMLDEMSTGFAGAIGRQVTLNADTAGPGLRAETEAMLADLEAADAKGVVNLRGPGMRINEKKGTNTRYSYDGVAGHYAGNGDETRTREELLDAAAAGELVLTLTAHLRQNDSHTGLPQPLVAPRNPNDGPMGNPDLPLLPAAHPMLLRGIDVHQHARLFMDGQPVTGAITCDGGAFTPFCDSNAVTVELASIPAEPGLHLFQVQNPAGPLSNELPVCVGIRADCL